MSEWIYFVHVSRENFGATMTDDEKETWGRHAIRLGELEREGTVILAGPTLGKINTGICIFEAPSEEAARDIMNADPTILSGCAKGQLRPFRATYLRGRANS